MTNSMREPRPRTVCVGEATVEFVRGGDGRFGMGCSGDTFNVAVYLARAGIDTAFATALGDDAYSEAILALATAEGVAGDLVLRQRGRLPGLVVVDTDAAGALLACDALWRTGMSRDDLLELAAELGSDVPFALSGHTAVGSGRGHLLTPALSRGEFHWAFAVQDRGLSTAAVYAAYDELADAPRDPEAEDDVPLMQALRAGDPRALGAALHNDLQLAALSLDPGLAEPLAVAQDAGALGVVVSGSGPTIAALGRSRQHALVLAAAFTASGVADRVLTAAGPVAGARVVSSTD